MLVRKVQFENFRNLIDGAVELDEGINVIYGSNGMGKTNFIETMWIIGGRRSFRGVKDNALIKITNGKRENSARICARFFSENREQTAEMILGAKKTATLNGVDLQLASKMQEHFHSVVFSPTDLELVEDSPQIRRKWLDDTISAMRPKYDEVLSLYRKCLDQRNAVLKNYFDNKNSAEMMLEIYDHHLSSYGEFLIKQRRLYLKAVSDLIPPIFEGLSRGSEQFELEYACGSGCGSREELAIALKTARENDIKYASTTVGPHRDDVTLNINGLNVKTFASQGQKRSAVLALKLCEAQIVENNTDERPIILLDDVMSELDTYRRDYVLNKITGGQVFITCCEQSTVDIQRRGKTFFVENGKVTEK